MNSITELLDLEDADIIISDISIEGSVKTLTLETTPSVRFCPMCGFRLHSKGIRIRKISHPVLQDNYELILRLKQRRWRCSSPECNYETNESFRFVDKKRRTTNASDMLIVLSFRDLTTSASDIAKRFHTSDTHVLDIFDRFVNLERLPLTDIISVDEVHVEMDEHCKYALVIQDFYTGDPIDILRSRRNDVTEPYFASIPIEERNRVRYLLSDMYNNYINYVNKYFPNAVSVVDAFHVIQWITRSIDNYIRALIKKYKQRDRELEERKSAEAGYQISLPISREVYMLTKYRWLILSNQENIRYHIDPRMDPHFHCLMNTYDYETELFKIDRRLERLRDLKEMYVSFNNRYEGHPVEAAIQLDKLIEMYFDCGDSIFIDFACLLRQYREPIINSFILVEKEGPGGIYDSRMSNGPIESLNRKVKDLKRLGRGFKNFEHFRNRFLYAARNAPVLNAINGTSTVQYFEEDEEDL